MKALERHVFTDALKEHADANLLGTGRNLYPGKGIVVGLDETGKYLVQVTWHMHKGDGAYTHTEPGYVFAESNAAEGSRYAAMSEVTQNHCTYYIVGSSQAANAVTDGYANDFDPRDSLRRFLILSRRETDERNAVPCVIASCYWRGTVPMITMSTLKQSRLNALCDLSTHDVIGISKGFGHCLAAYPMDGDLRWILKEDPSLFPLHGTMTDIAQTYSEVLNVNNHASVAVKFIPRQGPSSVHISNQRK